MAAVSQAGSGLNIAAVLDRDQLVISLPGGGGAIGTM